MTIAIPLWLLITVCSIIYLIGAGFFGPLLAFATQGDGVRDWTMVPIGLLWPVILPLFIALMVLFGLLTMFWPSG